MPRARVIVSIGEALLNERGDEVAAGGLAIAYAAAAAKVAGDNRCCAVSRVGQDPAGDELLRRARALGVDVEHVQSDPDLPTGRMITRSIAGRVNSTLTANAAFDNLQWDFDMVDLAQRCDVVVYGQLARRGGQTRSVIKQFLLECGSAGGGGALRVFDLTNRAADRLDRSEATSGLEFCDVVITDAVGLKALAPAMVGAAGDESTGAAIRDVLRHLSVQVVLCVTRTGEREIMRGVSRGDETEATAEYPAAHHEAVVIRAMLSLLDGADLTSSISGAATKH